ncbi:phosphate acetyltransferase, partial [Leucobacter sp. M11]|uniref:phosphate acetyltransferase n=1 Tax=Leucobacter sp. M11 TaxID=2993565 RepID=UPI002D7FBE3F
MANSIYLTSAEGRTGKSAVALGVLDMLMRDVPVVGVFRPLVRSGEPDRVLDLLLTHAGTELAPEACVGVSYEAAHADPDAALNEIITRYRALQARCDAVLIVGSDFSDVAVPTELSFNARIAANLGAPVLLVLGGRGSGGSAEMLGQSEARTPSELQQLTDLCLPELAGEHATLLGIVVNRADPEALSEIIAAVRASAPAAGTPVWALPEDQLLVAPSVGTILSEVEGTLVRGNPELLAREALNIVVAGMSMENVLPRLIEGAIIIIAADRSETLLAVTMAHEGSTFPTAAAIILNGDFPVPHSVNALLDGIGSELPVIRTELGTYATAQRVTQARGLLSPESPRKFDTALALFDEHVDAGELSSRLQLHAGDVVTPLMFSYELFERARAADAHIVLPEGGDDRILRAASTLLARGVARLTLLGAEADVRQRASELGLDLTEAAVIDPATSELRERFAAEYARLRAHKGVTVEHARDVVIDVSYFGTLMVHLGLADGMVSGAANTTAHTIKPSFEIIKTKPGVSVVSSVFFMALADRVLVYGDCAVNPE